MRSESSTKAALRSNAGQDASTGLAGRANGPLPAAFERLERELGGREFFAGDFSIVDCEIIPFVAGLADADMAIPPKCGNLLRWRERVSERPSYRAAEVDSRFTASLLRESSA